MDKPIAVLIEKRKQAIDAIQYNLNNIQDREEEIAGFVRQNKSLNEHVAEYDRSIELLSRYQEG